VKTATQSSSGRVDKGPGDSPLGAVRVWAKVKALDTVGAGVPAGCRSVLPPVTRVAAHYPHLFEEAVGRARAWLLSAESDKAN